MKQRRIFIMLVAAMTVGRVDAQSVTYNHDSAKQNQITVMETGSGSLTPEFYYWLLHNGYKKSAASKNKLTFRTLAGINLYGQVDDAERIDSALTKRAEIEALNMADRQIDLAWLAESEKINTQLRKMEANIDKIIMSGGTVADRKRWKELYDMYCCALTATKEAYMPNAQRKKEYLKIYADLVAQNETLIKYLVQLSTRNATAEILEASNEITIDKGTIVKGAKARWHQLSPVRSEERGVRSEE